MIRFMYLCLLVCVFVACKENTKEPVKIETEEVVKTSNRNLEGKKVVKFPSKDGLIITADVYKLNDKDISILLCHQAGFSRGEYKDTAIQLNKLGYSVIAIDQRSGEMANDVLNETAKTAKAKGLSTTYLDARQDIEAAIDYVFTNNGNKPILLVGSSYSASLALLIGKSNDKIKAVAAFSPGEYFKGININSEIEGYDKPVFVTSSKQEAEKLSLLVNKVNKKYLTYHAPTEKGIHGSRALWKTTEGADTYWKTFKDFLVSNNLK